MPKTKKTGLDKPNTGMLIWLRLKAHPLILCALITYLCISTWGVFSLFDRLFVEQQQQGLAEASRSIVLEQAGRVNQFLKLHAQQIERLEAAGEAAAKAIRQQDSDEIARLEKMLAESVNRPQTLYLLTPGDRRLDTDQNFAGIEMVKEVLAGQPAQLQAARLQSGWQLLIAIPVRNNDSIIGAIFSSHSLGNLQQSLAAADRQGQTRLYQQLANSGRQAFITTGQEQPSLPAFSQSTNHPQWLLEFTGGEHLLASTKPALTNIIVLPAILAAVALIVFLFILIAVVRRYAHEPLPLSGKAKAETAEEMPQQQSSASSYLEISPPASEAEPRISTDKKAAPEQHRNEADKTQQDASASTSDYPLTVFRDYDIRGRAGDQINKTFALKLGGCLGSLALERGETALIVGYDGRLTSDELAEELMAGILATGCDVICLGMVPTPLLNFALHHLTETASGVMVTASHNPAPDNGFKIFIRERALCGDEITALRDDMIAENFRSGEGHLTEKDLSAEYADTIINDIVPASGLKVVVDAGNGVAGKNAIEVLQGIGCDVVPLYCDVDGNFPNHPPDTAVPEYLNDLSQAVRAMEADLGICLDGDGDRVVAISGKSRIIWPDELLMIFARDVVSRNPGTDVVFDVKCTRRLSRLISSYGGIPVMCKTGHSHLRNKIIECNALLGGEFSGHIIFQDRWHGFDDGIYAAARLIEIMVLREQSLEEILSTFEEHHSTAEIKIPVDEEKKFAVVRSLLESSVFKDARTNTMDGLLVEFPNAWGLVRASNTSPALTLRFEATSSEALEKIQSLFRQQLSSIDSTLTF